MDLSVNASQVLTSMITPAVLISASGMLVLSTSTRLSRVVDRTRVLTDRYRAFSPEANPADPKEQELILDQLSKLTRRVMLLRSAMTSLYVAISLFVTTSISVGVGATLDWSHGWVSVVLELAGTSALLYGSILLITEARVAVFSTLQEMNFVRDSIARR